MRLDALYKCKKSDITDTERRNSLILMLNFGGGGGN